MYTEEKLKLVSVCEYKTFLVVWFCLILLSSPFWLTRLAFLLLPLQGSFLLSLLSFCKTHPAAIKGNMFGVFFASGILVFQSCRCGTVLCLGLSYLSHYYRWIFAYADQTLVYHRGRFFSVYEPWGIELKKTPNILTINRECQLCKMIWFWLSLKPLPSFVGHPDSQVTLQFVYVGNNYLCSS